MFILEMLLYVSYFQHTTNAQQPIAPNKNMKSVMDFSNLRMLCHDDIRAIRMVYQLPVKRDNAFYDDVCRRDFPMNKLQQVMYQLNRLLILLSILILINSIITFILTLIYLFIRHFYEQRSSQSKSLASTSSTNSWSIQNKKANKYHRTHAYLWHDEMF